MSRWAAGAAWAGAALLAFIALRALHSVLLPFLLAGILAYLLYPVVRRLEERAVPRSVAILLLYACLAVVVGLVGWHTVPRLAREVQEAGELLPAQARRWSATAREAVQGLRRVELPLTLQQAVNGVLARLEGFAVALARRTVDLLMALVGSLLSFLLAPVLAFYLLRDWERLRDFALTLLPQRRRAEAVELAGRVHQVLAGFVRGQLAAALVVAILMTVAMAVLQVRFALLIGVVAGLFNVIPYFGPVIGGIPAISLGLLHSPRTALWVVVAIVAINQVESAIITPRLLAPFTGLHPLTVLFVLLAGGQLFGTAGLFLAVPLTAVGKTVLLYTLRR